VSGTSGAVYRDGVQAVSPVVEKGASGVGVAPPLTLTTQHSWPVNFPTWESNGACMVRYFLDVLWPDYALRLGLSGDSLGCGWVRLGWALTPLHLPCHTATLPHASHAPLPHMHYTAGL
jgi:hypothetical protein